MFNWPLNIPKARAYGMLMQIYLPIAEVSVNAFLLLGLGGMVGVLSGMFGVGGGFLMTPLLFFIGIPPPSQLRPKRTRSSHRHSRACWRTSDGRRWTFEWAPCC